LPVAEISLTSHDTMTRHTREHSGSRPRHAANDCMALGSVAAEVCGIAQLRAHACLLVARYGLLYP